MGPALSLAKLAAFGEGNSAHVDIRHQFDGPVAGFGKDDLDLEVRENVLTVTGRKNQGEEDDGRNFVHRGIAERAFERRFHLADHVFVKNADLADGLLVIQLQREIPEALKPRKIEIGSNGKSRKAIEGKSKAA